MARKVRGFSDPHFVVRTKDEIVKTMSLFFSFFSSLSPYNISIVMLALLCVPRCPPLYSLDQSLWGFSTPP